MDRITIYNWFDAWESHHFAGLYDKKRCGCPPKLTDDEQNKAQYYLEQYPRDIRKVVPLLEQDTSKRVSTKTIKRLVKKNRYVWKRITKAPEKSPDPQQYERSTALIQRLQDQESRGISELWYFDVSGFCLTPYIPYAWQPMGSVIEIPTSTHRHRLNVLGFMNLHNGLYPYISLPDTFTSHFEMNT